MRFKDTRKQVEAILTKYPATRNSDTALTGYLWEEYYSDLMVNSEDEWYLPLYNLNKVPSQDNIKRLRADFNSKGLYLPTSELVARQRKINAEEWKQYMSKHNATREMPF